jgi:hypothetical protein
LPAPPPAADGRHCARQEVARGPAWQQFDGACHHDDHAPTRRARERPAPVRPGGRSSERKLASMPLGRGPVEEPRSTEGIILSEARGLCP